MTVLLTAIASGFTVLGAAVSAFILFRNNLSQVNSEALSAQATVIDAQREQINQLKEKELQNRADITKLSAEVGKLNGMALEKDKRILLLESLLEGSDKASIEFKAKMSASTQEMKGYMERTTLDIKEIKDHLNKIDEKLPPRVL